MNKAEFHAYWTARGYTVQQVADWVSLGTVGDVTTYQVVAVRNSQRPSTFLVEVTDDGGPGESAVVAELVPDNAGNFAEELRDWAQGLENATRWAVVVSSVREADEFAILDVYTVDAADEDGDGSNTDFTVQQYIVKRRNGEFSAALL